MTWTDVSIEVFNRCAGSCPGCLLSAADRKSPSPVMSVAAFGLVASRLAAYGQATGLRFRPVLGFGDIPLLPVPILEGYLDQASRFGMPVGLTMTYADDTATRAYAAALVYLRGLGKDTVFDLTVDPVRLARQPAYGDRIREALETAPHAHVQVLLSEQIIRRYGPEHLAEHLAQHLPGQAMALGFTPSIENLQRARYRYGVSSAAAYAKRFYAASEVGRDHLRRELRRFEQSRGDYGTFLRQTFHVGGDLGIYPVGYTAFGDVLMDQRNGGRPLGNLQDTEIADILLDAKLAGLGIRNRIGLAGGGFDCDHCRYRDACEFNGVGMVRRLYQHWESRLGSCHGPVVFECGSPAA